MQSNLDRAATLNIALLFAHQADAAYWREWEMFGLPGGIQMFSAFNLLAFLLVLTGYVGLLRRTSAGFRNSLAIAALSACVLPIHAGFALAGFTQFDQPLSILLIVLTFAASLAQLGLTFRARREFGPVMPKIR